MAITTSGTLGALNEGLPSPDNSGKNRNAAGEFPEGILKTTNGPRYVSMIANGALAPLRCHGGRAAGHSAHQPVPFMERSRDAARRPRLIGTVLPTLSSTLGASLPMVWILTSS